MPANSAENVWPRAFLLQVLKRAVEEGCVMVGPLDRVKARSLGMSLNRLKRRNNAMQHMPPEYLQCSNSIDELEDGLNANLYVMYDKLPGFAELPAINSVENKIDMPVPPSAVAQPQLNSSGAVELTSTEPVNIDDFVASLVRAAAAGADEEG